VKTAAVLTISDSSSQGLRQDLSGPAVAGELTRAGFDVKHLAVLPDEFEQIRQELLASCALAQLVITVGGTGIAERDVTPEATLAVVEKVIDGIPERMRAEGAHKTPLAALSRGVCGTRGKSLILNLPGSPKAAIESLQAVIKIVPHALDLLEGKTSH